MPFWKKILSIFLITVFCVSSVLFIGLYWREYDIPERIEMFISYQLERTALSIAEARPEAEWPDWVRVFINRIGARNPNVAVIDGLSSTVAPAVLAQYADLYAQNKDLIGWISIKGTLIDYPVMQTVGDPEYYLHRNFSGKYQFSGTPFMDATSDILLPSANFLIYGHNMINDSLFGQLPDYLDQDFCEKHPVIKFDSIYETGEYEVIAVFLSRIYHPGEDVFKYYQWGMIEKEADFTNYVDNIKQLALYDTGKTAAWGDQLLTLSTCYYQTDEGRCVVVARKIK